MTTVSNRPGKLTWAITLGDDISLTLTFTDAAGDPIDLSGRTYVAEVLDTSLSSEATITVGTGSAASGILVLSLTDAQTDLLTPRGYFWKLVETNDTTTTTLLDGPFSVSAGGQAGIGSGNSSATVTVSQGADVTVTVTAGAVAALIADLSGVTDATTARTNLGLGAGAVLDAFPFTKPFAPAQGLLADVETGRVTSTLVCLSDSTTNDTGEWFDLLARWLAGKMPDYGSALYTVFDDANQAYGTPTLLATGDGTGPVVLSDTFTRDDGAAGNADSSTTTEQAWSSGTITSNQFVPTTAAPSTIHTYASDIYGTIDFTLAASAADTRVYLHASDANNCVFIQVTTTALSIYQRIGSTNTQLATAVVALNTATQYTLTFSTAGVKFTATVGAVSVTGYISPTTLATVGATDDLIGLYGAGGNSARFDNLSVRAQPTFLALNGAVGGKSLAYDYDATRFPKLVPYAPSLVLVSHSHNEGTETDDGEYDTMATKITSTYAGTPIAFSTQNPETTLRDEPWHEQLHAARQAIIRAFAQANGYGLVDAFTRFRTDQPALDETTYMLGDGTHPKPAGSQAWFNEAKRLFGVADQGTT